MLKKFLPETPDKYLNTSADLPLARFGHINQLVNAINNLEESSGGGIVESLVEGDNISIDNTDPANPIISADIPEVTGFVPLAGTAGNPITGDIEMDGIASFKKVGTSATNSLKISNGNTTLKTIQNTGTISAQIVTSYSSVEGAKCILQATDNINDAIYLGVKASTTSHTLEVNSDNADFGGIQYTQDFSANYTDDSLITRKDAPEIISASVDPTKRPNKIGDIYINTSTPTIYISTGSALVTDWKQVF